VNGRVEDTTQREGVRDRRRIVVVGACASGKSLLVSGLRAHGYRARQCLQEHSYVPDMCYRLSQPDVVIYLEATLETIARRRKIDYGMTYWEEQKRRLRYVATHADLVLDTDLLQPADVLARTLDYLRDTAEG